MHSGANVLVLLVLGSHTLKAVPKAPVDQVRGASTCRVIQSCPCAGPSENATRPSFLLKGYFLRASMYRLFLDCVSARFTNVGELGGGAGEGEMLAPGRVAALSDERVQGAAAW